MTVPTRTLLFDQIAPGRAFHAASINAARAGTALHDHDYYEMMYVLQGSGDHVVRDDCRRMTAGELILIRPDDAHTIYAGPRDGLHFFNVAFPAATWRDFCVAAQIEPDALAGPRVDGKPPTVLLDQTDMAAVASIFEEALTGYEAQPSRLQLCGFLGRIVPYIVRKKPAPSLVPAAGPRWLRDACRGMLDPDNLAEGLPKFVELSGVGYAHLSRTLRDTTGHTPTEFVNEIRLRRSAALLGATQAEIVQIALDCGFENLSYFYRLFGARFGRTPREYRNERQR